MEIVENRKMGWKERLKKGVKAVGSDIKKGVKFVENEREMMQQKQMVRQQKEMARLKTEEKIMRSKASIEKHKASIKKTQQSQADDKPQGGGFLSVGGGRSTFEEPKEKKGRTARIGGGFMFD